MMENQRKKLSLSAILPHVFNMLVLGLILGYAIWFGSDGHYPRFHFLENYYVNFSEALKKGQVALLDQPDPRLAMLSDPHQAPNSGIPFLWDVSYYHGKYYIYWGPTPVIYYLVYSLIRGKPAPAQLGALFAYAGIACVLLATLYLLRWRFFPRAPAFSIGIFLLAALINPPYAFLLSRPLTYETAILTGQLCLLLGIFFFVLYLIHEKGWLLVPAGLSWGLAVLARYDLVIPAAIYTAGVLLYLWITRPAAGATGQEHAARRAVLLILPLALCALGLEFYNTVRFGSPLETGLRYQLTTPVESYYSPHFVASNLYVYLFYPNPLNHAFPFVNLQKFHPESLPAWAKAAPGKQFDYGFYGLFSSTPLLWFEGLALVTMGVIFTVRRRSTVAQRRLAIARTAGSTGSAADHEVEIAPEPVPVTGLESTQSRLPIAALQTMLLLAALLQLVFLLFYYYSAVRFLSDFWLPLLLAGFLVFWELDSLLTNRNWLRGLFWLVLTWAALQTAALGFLSGFTLFPFYFARHNLDTYYTIHDDLNMHVQAIYTFLKPTSLPGLIARWADH